MKQNQQFIVVRPNFYIMLLAINFTLTLFLFTFTFVLPSIFF